MSLNDMWDDDEDRAQFAVEAEATKPQEPIGYDDIFNAIAEAASPCGEWIGVSVMAFKRVIGGEIYTTPQPCLKCAEGMVSVTKEDANNYCRILTLLGMEEEGSPVEGVERLISLRDGMTCGDCNDTGWLENREEGRYPCTCMTEAEPYQLLQAKCAELEAECLSYANFAAYTPTANERIKELEAELEHAKSFAIQQQHDEWRKDREERDALAIVIQKLRDGITTCIAYKATPSSELLKIGYDTSEIIKRHDASVLRKAAKHFYASDELIAMAMALELEVK